MCLAVPMKLIEIHADGRGVADVDGTRYDVNLSLVTDPAVGDHVIVHAGYAIEKLDEHEAEQRLSLFSLMASLQRREGTA